MARQPWHLPPLKDILVEAAVEPDLTPAKQQALVIEKVMAELGAPIQVREVRQGPSLIQFSLKPDPEVKVSQIKRLDQDLSVALSGLSIFFEDPTPHSPYLKLMIPNTQAQTVCLRQILESPLFQKKEGRLKIGLGLNPSGGPVIIDLAEMPHLLLGGMTGSGKSVCLNAMIATLLCTYPPDYLQLALIDPLQVELKHYIGLPHLFAPVVTRSEQVVELLQTINGELDHRFTTFSKLGVRDLVAYNLTTGRTGKTTIPYLVVVIDNLVDLMLQAAAEVEQPLTRLGAMGRSAGVHLVFATQRSNVDIVSGALKANASGRIAFQMTGSVDSRLVLDEAGAETLIRPGDMLYKAPNTTRLQRVQGVFVSEVELNRLVRFWRRQ
jgi:S-DNA-T family DNA segregation ATPase FtsK/SpoIIIE